MTDRLTAHGLGSSRNEMPAFRRYVHPGWVNGVPSQADNPPIRREAAERMQELNRAKSDRAGRREAAARGECYDCLYRLDSPGHATACGP